MGKHAQMVIGPAGSGKSTYCSHIQQHGDAAKRVIHVINLDPAADKFTYDVAADIRDLISLQDVMEELNYGPNGALVYCMEYLIDNLDWLEEVIDSFDDDYVLFDCPGQIELYSHIPVMRRLADTLQKWGYNICAVHLIDSHFIADAAKFMSASLVCLSAMVQLELPHVNVLSKCDLLQNKKKRLDMFLHNDVDSLMHSLKCEEGSKMYRLNEAMGHLLEQYSLVSYVPFDISDEDSIAEVLMQVDNAIQYGEDVEFNEKPEYDQDHDEEGQLYETDD